MRVKTIALAIAALAACIVSAQAAQPTVPDTRNPVAAASPAMQMAPAAAVSDTAPSLTRADLSAWLDGYVPYALKSGDIAGAVVAVVKNGQVLFEKGYGYADVANRRPMNAQTTMIRTGSTSKLFTWTAVMQLVAEGKLDLDVDVNRYLDFRIPHMNGKAVTLRDLMNHRPGFEEGLKDILSTDPDGLESTEQYLKLHPRPMLFTPGSVPAYSNYGAALAGYIVQRVSGEPFEAYVRQHIFDPLGMRDSTFRQPLPKRFAGKVSNGYVTASGQPQPYELVVTRPAGSMTTTADDMTHFMIAHLQMGEFAGRRILSADAARLMHSPSETGRPGFAVMAHGFFYGRKNGHVVIGHGGDTVLFHTELDLLPQDGVGIFYSFNSRGKNDAVYGARQDLLDGFMDRYFPAPPPGPRPPTLASAKQDAQKIAGQYESSRRVEHGFLSLVYLLQQSAIAANPDGTVTAPAMFSPTGVARFREVGPQLWQEEHGTRKLALTNVDGVKTVVDSEEPIAVLQAVPFFRSASLNTPILLGSAAVLLWTLILWPLSWLVERADRATSGISAEARRLRLFLRLAAAVDVIYLIAWMLLLQPLLNSQLQVYSYRLDPVVGALEICGVLAVAAAFLGAWAVWRLFKLQTPWLMRIWNVAVVAALFGIVWIGTLGGLIGFNLNY